MSRWLSIPLTTLALLGLGTAIFIIVTNWGHAPIIGGGNTSTTTPPTISSPVAPASLDDLISVSSPLPGAIVSSPLTVVGRARGNWFFEASAPIELRDASDTVIAQGHAQAQSDWMTTDYVPFTATLTFVMPNSLSSTSSPQTGTLVLKNDNPSGNPASQKELDIPVRF